MKTISCRVNPIFFVMFFRTIKIHHHELQRENQQLKKATKELQKEIQTLSQSKTTLKEAVSEDDKALLQNEIQVLQKELSQRRAALWWRMWSTSILEVAEDNKRAQKRVESAQEKRRQWKKSMEELFTAAQDWARLRSSSHEIKNFFESQRRLWCCGRKFFSRGWIKKIKTGTGCWP